MRKRINKHWVFLNIFFLLFLRKIFPYSVFLGIFLDFFCNFFEIISYSKIQILIVNRSQSDHSQSNKIKGLWSGYADLMAEMVPHQQSTKEVGQHGSIGSSAWIPGRVSQNTQILCVIKTLSFQWVINNPFNFFCWLFSFLSIFFFYF